MTLRTADGNLQYPAGALRMAPTGLAGQFSSPTASRDIAVRLWPADHEYSAAPGSTTPSDPVPLVERLFQARNQGDSAAAAALFSDPTDFFGGPPCRPCTNRVGVQAQFQQQFENGARYTVRDVRATGTTVTWRVEVRGPNEVIPGIERRLINASAETRGGLISVWRTSEDVSDPQTARFLTARDAALVPQQLPRTGDRGLQQEAAGIVGAGAWLALAGVGLGWMARLRRRAPR